MVSIILVNYNGYQDTIECIKSLNKMDYAEYKVIVVDNCSTDNSFEVLQENKNEYNFELLKADENKGFSAGNNVGIKYALSQDCDYILLLNNDTVVETDFLTKLLEGFKYSDKCGATISKILFYSKPDTLWYAGGSLNSRTARTEHWGYNTKDMPDNNRMTKVSFATGCCLCMARETVEKIGLLDEDYFLYDEDAEYSYRIQKYGYDIIYVPQAIIYHKVSASTGAGSPMSQYYMVRNKYYFIKSNFVGLNKLSAYLYCTSQFLYRCIKKEIKLKYYMAGLKAFIKKEKGKAIR